VIDRKDSRSAGSPVAMLCEGENPKGLDMGKLCTRADTERMDACAEAVDGGEVVVMSKEADSVDSDAGRCRRFSKISREPVVATPERQARPQARNGSPRLQQ
jgi:hypothetical protein